ncbi:MAG TPA: hypothetical protein VMI10_22540 [Terriglobales bacterium]|nr:hypothetical protein [Terriglobales bacterium]
MPTEFCQKCKQSHPGRACDYDDKGDCAETADLTDIANAIKEESKEKE